MNHLLLSVFLSLSPSFVLADDWLLQSDVADIYPIGFSKKDIFGYIYLDYLEGYQSLSLVTISLKTDTSEMKHLVGDFDHPIGPKPSLSEIQKKYTKEIADFKKKYDLHSGTEYKLQKFPIKFGDDELDVSFKKIESDMGPINKVFLNSKKLGSKQIGETSPAHMPNPTVALGYLKSPFSDRVVVFVRHPNFGAEYAHHDLIKVLGAHLTSGFGKGIYLRFFNAKTQKIEKSKSRTIPADLKNVDLIVNTFLKGVNKEELKQNLSNPNPELKSLYIGHTFKDGRLVLKFKKGAETWLNGSSFEVASAETPLFDMFYEFPEVKIIDFEIDGKVLK